MFFTLIVGASGSIAPAPPREPTIDIFYIDGGCSRISESTRQGDAIDFFYVDGGCSQFYNSGTSQVAHRQRFLR
jgi:hypothetical protein